MAKKKIYILHGWAYATEKWEPFLDLLKQQEIEPIFLKIPGLTAPLKEVWTLDNYVSWLHDIVSQEKEKVVLLGHSNGGRIILAFAAKYPEKVQQLFLIDSAGIYHNELSIRIKRFVFKSVAKIGKRLTKSDRARYWIYRFAREMDYQKADPVVRKTMRNLIDKDLTQLLTHVNIPTKIVWGADDRVTPLSDGKLIEKLLPHATLEIISGARHSPQFTHAEKVVEIISKNLL